MRYGLSKGALTPIGFGDIAVEELLPSWPDRFDPQHQMALPRIPHVDEPPAAIAVMLRPPETATGVRRSVVVPSPS